MTNLYKLQEAARLIDQYPDVIEIIRNSPESHQVELHKKLGNKYSLFWVGKIIESLKKVGLVNEIPTENQKNKYHTTNEVIISYIEKTAIEFSDLIQK